MQVLGLVQTVGIDEQRAVGYTGYLLADERQSWPKTDGGIRFHLQELSTFVTAAYYRRIVTAVAEVEPTGLEVDQTDEHGDKHTAFIVFG